MASPRLALALRHVHFEDCGTLAGVLNDYGFQIRYVDVGREGLRDLDVMTPELLIGLGGPVSVYESYRYPWIREELELLERRLTQRLPTLGICLGAQMLAQVLGARVFAGPKELGWAPLLLTPQGKNSVITPLSPETTSMLHWHGDTFDLPREAVLLASTSKVPQQVFSWEGCALAFQCHPEMQYTDIESWLIGHAWEIAATAGVSVERLRNDTARFGPVLAQNARAMFQNWLHSLGFGREAR
jgi:GMP synthase (glutamine-hydrolysing)